jgi:hypothetical protein
MIFISKNLYLYLYTMSILTNNISKSNLGKLQILYEIGLPLDIINYCMKPLLEHQIFVIIEIQNPVNITDLKTQTSHKFPLGLFEELYKTKPTLIQQIINSGLATIKFVKNKYTYFTFHAGIKQFSFEYIKNIKEIINTEYNYNDIEQLYYTQVEDLDNVFNNISLN